MPAARKAIARATLLCLLAASSGCRGDGGPGDRPAGAGPVRGGTAVVGVAAEPRTVLPPLAAGALDYELASLLFLGLNYGVWEDGALGFTEGHPLSLARGWRVGPAGRAIVYRLDPGRRWSDGRPLRAADVSFTYGLLADPELGLPLSSTAERLDSVVARNDSTVAFHLREPYPGILFDTGVGILPRHVYDAAGEPTLRDRGREAPVTSGPFSLERWTPEQRIVLVRNPESLTPPRLERLVVQIVPEEAARLTALRAGELDVAQVNSFRQAKALEADPEIRVLRIPQRGYDYVAWNPEGHPAFRDLRVRRALSLALDRTAILEALEMEGFGEPAHAPYGSLFSGLVPPMPDLPMHDPERSRRLLAEAGWADRDGDGVRERGDARLDFELATTAGNERRESAVQILQARFADVGVRARVRLEEFNALLGRVIEGDYEAALLGWQVGLDPDIAAFWYDPEGPFNVVRYDSPAVRAAIDSARARPTTEAAAPFWRRAAARIAADYPYAFLWFFDLPVAVGPRLRGVEVDVTGFLGNAHQWWIPRDRRRHAARGSATAPP